MGIPAGLVVRMVLAGLRPRLKETLFMPCSCPSL